MGSAKCKDLKKRRQTTKVETIQTENSCAPFDRAAKRSCVVKRRAMKLLSPRPRGRGGAGWGAWSEAWIRLLTCLCLLRTSESPLSKANLFEGNLHTWSFVIDGFTAFFFLFLLSICEFKNNSTTTELFFHTFSARSSRVQSNSE